MISTSEKTIKPANIIPLRNAGSDELEKISRDGLLSLSLTEMKAIQDYFSKLQRDPTDIELESLAQTWSEHCVHKTFKGQFTYTEEKIGSQTALAAQGPKSYQNLLKDTIVKTTEELSPSWCLSVFKDNAGVIALDEEDGISFKVETHNHPSALEPYGGAGTGIGGVIRDILGCGLGGKPVLNTDVFCFGPMDTNPKDLPKGALHPKRIAQGVISGVRDYGNRMGIPTANGAVYFDPGYTGNPLVFCGTVGLQPKSTVSKSVEPEDLVVVLGGRTGRDGVHGATFSSAPLESGITSNVVQIGNAIMEKKVMDVLLAARDKNLYRSVTDCGAGGFSSAIGELGQQTGVRVDLELAPLKYQGLAPWEIWVSESQERMVLAVPPDNWNTLRLLFEQEDVEAVAVGEFTNDKKLTIRYKEETIATLDMDFLHDGVPKIQLDAVWNPKAYQKKHVEPAPSQKNGTDEKDIGTTLAWLLQHPVIASKESVVRQYDHEVQGGTVIKPFMGAQSDGPTDACVFRPKLNRWSGVAVSNGLNPEMGKYDPYVMAQCAVDEAYRNLIAVGGGLKRVAILDNFCWGDAKDPLEMGALVRAAEGAKAAALAYKLPFISGKDSFNNTWKSTDDILKSIPPTLLISAIGVVDDIRRCLTAGLKDEGNLLYIIGETQSALGGSLVNQQNLEKLDTQLPEVRLTNSVDLYKRLQTAMKHKTVRSCHDVSEGGVGVAIAEMAFGGTIGANIHVPVESLEAFPFLFSESPGRFLVEVTPSNKLEFEQIVGVRDALALGQTVSKPDLTIHRNNTVLFQDSVTHLKSIWKQPLRDL